MVNEPRHGRNEIRLDIVSRDYGAVMYTVYIWATQNPRGIHALFTAGAKVPEYSVTRLCAPVRHINMLTPTFYQFEASVLAEHAKAMKKLMDDGFPPADPTLKPL